MKKTAILLLALLLVLVLASCGGKGGEETASEEPQTEIVTVISTLEDGETVVETLIETVKTTASPAAKTTKHAPTDGVTEPSAGVSTAVTDAPEPVAGTTAYTPDTTKADTAPATGAGSGITVANGNIDDGWF